MVMSVMEISRRGLPRLVRDVGLSQKPNQKVYAYASSMRIGQNQPPVSSEHKLVSPARVGTIEPQYFQTPNQLAARHGRQPRRHADIFSGRRIVVCPNVGIGNPLAMLKSTQSSTASARWRRQASSVFPVAQTPGNSGTSP